MNPHLHLRRGPARRRRDFGDREVFGFEEDEDAPVVGFEHGEELGGQIARDQFALDADRRRIKRIRIRVPAKSDAEDAGLPRQPDGSTG